MKTMHHWLAIAVFSLMTAFGAQAQDGAPSCKANVTQDGATHSIPWTGKCINGRADGLGVWILPRTGSKPTLVVLNLVDGNPDRSNLYGSMTRADGQTAFFKGDPRSQQNGFVWLDSEACLAIPQCQTIARYNLTPLKARYQSDANVSTPTAAAIHTASPSTRTGNKHCPTTFHHFEYLISGMQKSPPRPLYEWVWFKYPVGTPIPTTGGPDIPLPRLSIPTPLQSNEQVARLTRDDWQKIRVAMAASRSNWNNMITQAQGDPTQRDWAAGRVKEAMAEREQFDAIMDCYGGTATDAASTAASTAPAAVQLSGRGEEPDGPATEASRLLDTQRSNYQQAQSGQGKSSSASSRNLNAPYARNDCVQMVHNQSGTTLPSRWQNRCAMPIAVIACAAPPNTLEQRCATQGGWGTTSVIPPGGSYPFVRGFTGPWQVKFFVCDMTDGKKLCRRPK